MDLLEIERESRTEINNLMREFEQVQKALKKTRHKLIDMEVLQGKLEELNAKAVRLEAEVNELKAKMAKSKEVDIAKF